MENKKKRQENNFQPVHKKNKGYCTKSLSDSSSRKISAKSEVSITHEQLSFSAKYIQTVLRMSRPSFVGSAFQVTCWAPCQRKGKNNVQGILFCELIMLLNEKNRLAKRASCNCIKNTSILIPRKQLFIFCGGRNNTVLGTISSEFFNPKELTISRLFVLKTKDIKERKSPTMGYYLDGNFNLRTLQVGCRVEK